MKTRFFALVLSVTGTIGALAASPLGTFIYDFSVTNNPVWDLSGPIEFSQAIGGVAGVGIPLRVPITLDESIKGQLNGSGYSTMLVDTNPVNLRFKAGGKIYTASTATKVKLDIRASGRDVINGVTNNIKLVLIYRLVLDPLTRTLSGSVKGTAVFSVFDNGRINQDVAVTLPEFNDGSWSLRLDLSSGAPPGGNAAVLLPNGRFLQYSARGSYSESKDRTKLSLRGFGNSRGSKISLRLVSTNAILTDLGGRLLGQKLNEPAEAALPRPQEPTGDDNN